MTNLETIAGKWKSLKENGKGSILCTGSNNILESFPEEFFPRGLHEFEQAYSLVDTYFGTEYRKDINKSDDDRNGSNVLLLMRQKGDLWLFSMGMQTFDDYMGRSGTYFFLVGGDENILRESYEEIKKEPTRIRDFVKNVFGWRNHNYQERSDGNTFDEEGRAKASQADLITKMKKLSVLDGSDYGLLKKIGIVYKKNNPEVVDIMVNNQS
jgi:hypothetical protein